MVRNMKCLKCGKDCNDSNSIASRYVCPFCGDAFNLPDNSSEDFANIMVQLVQRYGIEVLEDVGRTNALLMDYAPHSDKARKLIILVMREGVVSQLIKIADGNDDEKQLKLNRCVNQLLESIWITESAARYAVSILAISMGINAAIENYEGLSKLQTNISETTDNQVLKVLTKDAGVTSEDAIYYALNEINAIGYKALATNLNIKNLVLSDMVKVVYPKAFLNCINLCSIRLPKGIRDIGICAFEGCSSLERIEITDGIRYKVVDSVLIDKENKWALRAGNITSKEKIRIANGVTTICKKAFDCSPVRCVSIPASVNNIEVNAFYLTQSLESFEVDPKNCTFRAISGVLHDRSAKVLVKYPQGRKEISYYLEDAVEEIGIQAFSCAENLQTITFSSALRRIGFKAFEYCTNIENVMLPVNVEVIGDRAFQYCEKMRSVMLSKNISEIGDCAFYNCVSLETISIPKSVKSIGNFVFANCENIKTVTIQENISFVGDGAFVGCQDIEILIKNNQYMETYCRSRGIRYSHI